MTNERLQELRKMVDKCWEILTPDELDDLLSLIDSAMKPTSEEIQRAIVTMELLDMTALNLATTFRANPYEQDSADMMKRRSEDISLAITALRAYGSGDSGSKGEQP